MALADGSNSRASSFTLRPARANSMIRRRYSAGYGGRLFGMGNSFFLLSPTPSTKTGQLQLDTGLRWLDTGLRWLDTDLRWFADCSRVGWRVGTTAYQYC